MPLLHKDDNEKEPHLLITTPIVPFCLYTNRKPAVKVHKKAFVKYVKELDEAQST